LAGTIETSRPSPRSEEPILSRTANALQNETIPIN